MAIFNSYVSLPEGTPVVSVLSHVVTFCVGSGDKDKARPVNLQFPGFKNVRLHLMFITGLIQLYCLLPQCTTRFTSVF